MTPRPCKRAKLAPARVIAAGGRKYACKLQCEICRGAGYVKPCGECEGCGMRLGVKCDGCGGIGIVPAPIEKG